MGGAGAEACTDGIDNDGDGYVDCEDPDCQPAFQCVLSVPRGWEDPVAIHEGSAQPPGCEQSGFPVLERDAHTDIDAGTLVCPSCQCTVATSSFTATLEFFSGAACTGSCWLCATPSPFPKPSPPFEQTACIHQVGDVPCARPFSKKRLGHLSFADNRGCAPCVCGEAKDVTCADATIWLGTENGVCVEAGWPAAPNACSGASTRSSGSDQRAVASIQLTGRRARSPSGVKSGQACASGRSTSRVPARTARAASNLLMVSPEQVPLGRGSTVPPGGRLGSTLWPHRTTRSGAAPT